MSDLSTEAKYKLEELKQEYVSSLKNKVEALEACMKNNDLDELRMKCHKIAGSSASFDLPDISFAARTLEALCKTRLENNQAGKIDIKSDKTLADSFAVLLDNLQRNR
ncbi:MAG: Hpt domain-containing protein [Pseudomonadota bacterium]